MCAGSTRRDLTVHVISAIAEKGMDSVAFVRDKGPNERLETRERNFHLIVPFCNEVINE